jgi:cell division septation protein DedD
MARRTARRGSGDRVLESKHLVALFLGVVLLCAVFFSLGYVMGRSQYAGLVHAAYAPGRDATPASLTEKMKPQEPPPSAAPAGEWDFYSNKNNNRLEAPPKGISPAPPASSHSAVAPPPSSPADSRLSRSAIQQLHSGSPKMLAGSIVLQIAAVTRQGDALSMAEALQRKKIPAFVVAPSADRFYRVQVGPYHDERAADAAKAALDHAGFKAIIKR